MLAQDLMRACKCCCVISFDELEMSSCDFLSNSPGASFTKINERDAIGCQMHYNNSTKSHSEIVRSQSFLSSSCLHSSGIFLPKTIPAGNQHFSFVAHFVGFEPLSATIRQEQINIH